MRDFRSLSWRSTPQRNKGMRGCFLVSFVVSMFVLRTSRLLVEAFVDRLGSRSNPRGTESRIREQIGSGPGLCALIMGSRRCRSNGWMSTMEYRIQRMSSAHAFRRNGSLAGTPRSSTDSLSVDASAYGLPGADVPGACGRYSRMCTLNQRTALGSDKRPLLRERTQNAESNVAVMLCVAHSGSTGRSCPDGHTQPCPWMWGSAWNIRNRLRCGKFHETMSGAAKNASRLAGALRNYARLWFWESLPGTRRHDHIETRIALLWLIRTLGLMPSFNFTEHPHRRYNPLKGEWVLCSPHRAKRPWQGAQETVPGEERPRYDPACYLCPGNARAGGAEHNPRYESTFVFTNDFPALLLETPVDAPDADGDSVMDKPLFQARAVRGTCRVVCFSPRHDLTLAEMTQAEICRVVDTWQQQYTELAAMPEVQHVQIFENKGSAMGCSNPHPHGQIWASSFIPNEVAAELRQQASYFSATGRALLLDYVEAELQRPDERIVCRNTTFVALVPFWAVWPFEIMVLPTVSFQSLLDMNASQKNDLADILRRVAARYDNLFQTSFPYSMGLHQAPVRNGTAAEQSGLVFHIHFYPPLLRSATVRKFMVGFEMLAESQRDLTAEQAADRLRSLPERHYRTRSG